MERLLIVGCGYVGQAVARNWLQRSGLQHSGLQRSSSVQALTRGGTAVDELAALGIQPVIADWLDSELTWHLPFEPEVALVAVPHREDPRFGARTHVVGLINLLRNCRQLRRLIVLSTTGVYHQNDGSWVDEQSATEPTRIGPQIALAAEQWLREHCDERTATSLRLAGIYGPGRVPLLAKLRAQEPIPVGTGSLNLIHLDDIANVIERLLETPTASRLYVLSDGSPVERRQFYVDAARIFNTPDPQFMAASSDTARGARSESNKRINPARIMRELNITLKYPNHVSGLEALASTASP